MLEVFSDYLGLTEVDDLNRAASYVLSLNLAHGDAMTMRETAGAPISVPAIAKSAFRGPSWLDRRESQQGPINQEVDRARGNEFAHLCAEVSSERRRHAGASGGKNLRRGGAKTPDVEPLLPKAGCPEERLRVRGNDAPKFRASVGRVDERIQVALRPLASRLALA